jgi:site-specific DNA-methyltransferase (adenine-specific)
VLAVTPYYADDRVTIYHGDCLDLGLSIETPAAIVTDPPYGMGWDTDGGRFSGGGKTRRPEWSRGKDWGGPVRGDNVPFDPSPWLDFPEVILWGANHYAARLPVGTTLVWVKRFDSAFGTFLSDAEIAWQKGGHGVYCHRIVSGSHNGVERVHPTQKPLQLMRWCIDRTTATLVIDPYMGSGTTLVAAKAAGRRAIGIEIEERYCEIAANRCRQEVLGLSA